MLAIILASHGNFAKGILQSGAMIFGEQEKVVAITLDPSSGPENFRAELENTVNSFGEKQEILFLVDLWGGTPFNQASSLIAEKEGKYAIVTGLNLPMLLEAYGSRMTINSAHDVASHILEVAKEGIKVKPEELVSPSETHSVNKLPSQENIPEGTIIGDGKIKIVLARIDSRLLHGQVATSWTKATNPDRIIVVSDSVAHDDLRKQLIEQAAPPGVKAHVVPLHKMIEVAKDPRFGKTKALLLFENPEDLAKVVEGGLEISEVNVGSMAHSVGKVMVNRVLSMDQNDVDAFKYLQSKGIEFDVRKVPNDSKQNLFKLIGDTANLTV